MTAMIRDDLIHASAVSIDGRGVVIMGRAGTGKSSLALTLMALGAGLVADDLVRLRDRDGVLMAGPADLAAWGEGPDGASVPSAPMADPSLTDSAAGRAACGAMIEARGVGLIPAPSSGPVPVVLAVDLDRNEGERLPPGRQIRLLGYPVALVLGPPSLHLASAVWLMAHHGRIDPDHDRTRVFDDR